MGKSVVLKDKFSGAYLFVKWSLSDVVTHRLVEREKATVFNRPTDDDPLNLSLLRQRGLVIYFMEYGLKFKDFNAEECEPTEEKLFSEEDIEYMKKEEAEIEKMFPSFFKKYPLI